VNFTGSVCAWLVYQVSVVYGVPLTYGYASHDTTEHQGPRPRGPGAAAGYAARWRLTPPAVAVYPGG